MPVYKVKMWYVTHVTHTVEAKHPDDAVEQCVVGGLNSSQETEAIANIEAMEFNNEVELANSQYTDQQELEDRERDNDKE